MEYAQPRILLITRNLPPLIGGMERLNWHIADELSRFANVNVVGPRGSAALRPHGVQIYEAPLRPLPRFLVASGAGAIVLAKRFRPQLVLAGSGVTAPAALLAARVVGARAAVYLHGLDAAVEHFAYRALWHPTIRRMDVVVANSSATAKLARELGVGQERIRIVHPGVALPPSAQDAAAIEVFRRRHGLGRRRVLLSVGRLTTRKGLREFVQHALPEVVRAAPDAILAIIGDAPMDALHATVQSRAAIQAAADAAGVGQHLRFLGVITDSAELACAYEMAALHIFPVRRIEGDPEGFGMVAIEAAAHGVPTVAFGVGGVVDAVAPGQSGVLIEPGNYAALSDAVVRVLADGRASWQERTAAFAQRFAWPTFGDSLISALLPTHARRTSDN